MSQEPTYRVGIIGTCRIASTIQDEIADGPFHFLLPYSHAGAYAAVPATRVVAAAVNHMRTYDVYYRRVRQLVERDAIGTLHAVMAHWHEGMLFGGTHLFDALRFLVGAEADWVFGRLDQGDGVFDRGGSGMVRFANGVDAFINNRTGHAAPSEFDLVGSAGRIRLGNTLYPELYTRDERAPASGLARRVFPGALVAKSGMTVAVEELLAAIEQGTKPGSDLRDARADLELALAFDCSDRERRPVQLPLADLDLTIEDPWGRG
jgi:predicted dehydrogenase